MDLQGERPRCALVNKGLLYYFKQLSNPRRQDNTLHRLANMIVLAICAVIRGADGCRHQDQTPAGRIDPLKDFS